MRQPLLRGRQGSSALTSGIVARRTGSANYDCGRPRKSATMARRLCCDSATQINPERSTIPSGQDYGEPSAGRSTWSRRHPAVLVRLHILFGERLAAWTAPDDRGQSADLIEPVR